MLRLRHSNKIILNIIALINMIYFHNQLLYSEQVHGRAGAKFQRDFELDVPACKDLNISLLASWRPVLNFNRLNNTNKHGTESHKYLSDINHGGKWQPINCTPNRSIAIVVPYRDRKEHLRIFLYNMHHMLHLQMVKYGIYVIEQRSGSLLNRGMLLNIGYDLASKDDDYDCFIFHDVDLIPENATNLYRCGENPRHLCHAVDKFSYRLPYKEIFGGVTAFTSGQFLQNNGYSNKYYKWGGEDDDMYSRNYGNGYKVDRPPIEIARYRMLSHKQQDKNPYRFLLGRHSYRKQSWNTDGINNLKYKILARKNFRKYSWILVDVDDSKADKFVQDALQNLRFELPERFRQHNMSDIKRALFQLKAHYRGPYQIAKVLKDIDNKKYSIDRYK